jgi:hypothetical protein
MVSLRQIVAYQTNFRTKEALSILWCTVLLPHAKGYPPQMDCSCLAIEKSSGLTAMNYFEARRRSSNPETPTELRTRAGHARQHARDNAGDEAEPRMLKLADELEARATDIETGPVATRLGKGWVVFR